MGVLCAEFQGSKSTDSVRLLALFSLGEIGRHEYVFQTYFICAFLCKYSCMFVCVCRDLSVLNADIMQSVLRCFTMSNEEVKSAASYALG